MLRISDDNLESYPEMAFYQNVILSNKQLNKIAFDQYFERNNSDCLKNYIQVLKKNKNVDLTTDLYPEWIELLEEKLNSWIKNQFDNVPVDQVFDKFLTNYNCVVLPDEYLNKTTKETWKKICILNHSDKFMKYAEETNSVNFMCSLFSVVQKDNNLIERLSQIYVDNLQIKTDNIKLLCQSFTEITNTIKQLFGNCNLFLNKLNDKFSTIINNPEETWLETIVNFVDTSISNNQTEYFDTLVSIIQLIKDKDIVEMLYRKKLSGRLVKNPNLDTEREFLSKLKQMLDSNTLQNQKL